MKQKSVGQLEELRELTIQRQTSGSPRLKTRVKLLQKAVTAFVERNKKFSNTLREQHESFVKSAIAAEEVHAENYVGIRKHWTAAKHLVSTNTQKLKDELNPFRAHQRDGIEHLGQMLQRYLDLQKEADVIHKEVTGTCHIAPTKISLRTAGAGTRASVFGPDNSSFGLSHLHGIYLLSVLAMNNCWF